MNEEGVTAILGLVLLTHEGNEVRIPEALIESGLPANSGVQVYMDEHEGELVVRISSNDEPAVPGE